MDPSGKKMVHHRKFSTIVFLQEMKEKKQNQKYFHLQSFFDSPSRKPSLDPFNIILPQDVHQISHKTSTAEAAQLQLRRAETTLRSYSPSVKSTTMVLIHCIPQVSHSGCSGGPHERKQVSPS